jgi:hypothetical protein
MWQMLKEFFPNSSDRKFRREHHGMLLNPEHHQIWENQLVQYHIKMALEIKEVINTHDGQPIKIKKISMSGNQMGGLHDT